MTRMWPSRDGYVTTLQWAREDLRHAVEVVHGPGGEQLAQVPSP